MERRTIDTAPAVQERAEGNPTISGLGAVFFDESDEGTEYKLFDDFVERIIPGAFDRAIREDDVRSMFNHDSNQLLGRKQAGTLDLSVDSRGLRYTVEPPVARADVVDAVRRGDVSGSSFMFNITDVVWRETEELLIREIHGVRLFEVGPVVFPAYESTTAEAKSRCDDMEKLHRSLLLEAQEHGIGRAKGLVVEVLRRRLALRGREIGLTDSPNSV